MLPHFPPADPLPERIGIAIQRLQAADNDFMRGDIRRGNGESSFFAAHIHRLVPIVEHP